MSKGCNGWTNYETWVVKLWMDNDYEMYQYFQELKTETTYELAAVIKNYFEENNPIQEASVYNDLLTSALLEVSWYEIAERLQEE